MAIKEVGAFEAKTHLSELLTRVGEGEAYYITRRGRRVAELRPSSSVHRPRFGCDKGRVILDSDFDAPIPELEKYAR
jgi:prevent-host-death family protein